MFLHDYIVLTRRIAPNHDAGNWTGHQTAPEALDCAAAVGGLAFKVCKYHDEGGRDVFRLTRVEEEADEEDPLETVAEGLNAIVDNAAQWSAEGIGRHALALQSVIREYIDEKKGS